MHQKKKQWGTDKNWWRLAKTSEALKKNKNYSLITVVNVQEKPMINWWKPMMYLKIISDGLKKIDDEPRNTGDEARELTIIRQEEISLKKKGDVILTRKDN